MASSTIEERLEGLNPEQREAATYGDGPLLVLAGAGSGKTRVLTTRIAWLVAGGVDARGVLAVTFTNKAAGEMRERLAKLLGELARSLWIGTFHSVCARLLRIYPERVGLTRDFTIFDDDDQKRLVAAILKDLNISERIAPRAVMSRIDRARNAGEDPAALSAHDYIDDVTRKVYPLYSQRLRKENACDFNDLLSKVGELCTDPELGPKLAKRYRHILVDEFQDTNRVQYDLVRHLASGFGNLCVVGDDDQSIYGWRGAEPKNLLDFDRDYPSAHVVKLEQNYRSTAMILGAANAVIVKNSARHDKRLWTARAGGEPLLLEECADERAEAEFIVQGILSLRTSESRPDGDFAVLYRTHAQSRVLEEAMRARRVPYRIVGGLSFFQRREVKDITEYLRLIANPDADTAFERVVNVPTRGIGDTTIDRLREYARDAGLSMLEAARRATSLGPAATRKLAGFVELIDGLRALMMQSGPLASLVVQVMERSDYRGRLEAEDKIDGPDRLRNLQELVAAAAGYDAEVGEGATLVGFNERIALTGVADQQDGRGECVTMMTIHAAKGLEFGVVFIGGMEEGIFPSLREGDRDEEIEEERRLAYVALTRAKDRAILSWARMRRTYDEIRRNEPSRFLRDIPDELVAVRRQRRPEPARRAPSDTMMAPRKGWHDQGDRPPPVIDDFAQDIPSDDNVYQLDDAGDDDPIFPRGAFVKHRMFGVGEITDGSGRGPDRKLSIRFPQHGMKTIVARFVSRVR